MNQFVRRWPEDPGMDLRVAFRSLRQYPLAAFVIPVGAIVLVGLAATWLPAAGRRRSIPRHCCGGSNELD